MRREGPGPEGADEVEFLDDETGGDGAADVLWLDEEGIGSARSPGVLPPRAAPHRVLASLLALGVLLAATGSAAAAAYGRHVTDRRIADALVLRATPNPPAIPDLPELGFTTVWHAQVTERVLVPVVNRGPRPVQLLGALLTEPGLAAAATLTPLVGRPLKPGETAEFAGTVTADCTIPPDETVDAPGFGGVVGRATAADLQVRAHTSGGTTAIAHIDPESEGADLQERICEQEGDELTGSETLSTATDAKARTVTIRLATAANADVPVDYTASAVYSADPGYKIPGLIVTEPIAQDPVEGTLNAGGMLTLTYVIDVRSCPSRAMSAMDLDHLLQLQLLFSVHGSQLKATNRMVLVDPLFAAACAGRSSP